jgi:hypothetical protein
LGKWRGLWSGDWRGKGNGSIRKDMKKLRPRKRGNWNGMRYDPPARPSTYRWGEKKQRQRAKRAAGGQKQKGREEKDVKTRKRGKGGEACGNMNGDGME